MKSKASFRGHPLHPALIPFPFAFLWGSAAFDLVGRLTHRQSFSTTGAHLAIAGIVMGLAAAIPGLIDYFGVVPPNSTGKTRATKHLLANASALALFALAWWIRGHPAALPSTAQLLLEIAGVTFITIGGWLGGTLVTRNQISIDHRYAGAGKWSEGSLQAQPGRPLVVAKSDDLQPNQMRLLHLAGRRIVLARTENGYVAFDDHCTHRGGSLADGVIICGTVQCPWHGSQFDVKTGAVKAGPAKESIPTYRIEQQDEEVRLTL